MPGRILEYFNRFRTYYSRAFAKFGEKYDLTQLDMDILLSLKIHPEWDTARDICTMRCIAKSNASNSLRGLERRKLVSITIDSENKKIHRLAITEEGEALARELFRIQQLCLEQMREGVTDEELRQVDNVVRRVDENIRKALMLSDHKE